MSPIDRKQPASADITPAGTQVVLPRSIVFTSSYVFFIIDDGIDADMDTFSHRLFHAPLAAGGAVRMPIQETFWAARFGMLVDKFGIPWMINCGPAA